MSSALRTGLDVFFSGRQLELLGSARIGVAGAGGIGSNVALMLVRSGVRRLFVADFDRVEAGNLNRQQYFPGDLGRPKVAALRERLLCLEPELDITTAAIRIDRTALPELLQRADLWVEAMDGPDDKRMFVEGALLAGKTVVACSGMAGIGGPPITVRRLKRLSMVGDFVTDIADAPPLAPRVTVCAALMADEVLVRILGDEIFALAGGCQGETCSR
ncbi:MAG: sulfur carrier protein ThiS adenylyltransferase ThiF [Desulfovibrionaceae bacterium]|nr:sulfur carrier protein ThiS adenylyltransferase ThiF [Desulfovibrionaceae bacterium]